MRKITREVAGGAPSVNIDLLFTVSSLHDIELIPSVSRKLGCSQATMYRTLEKARIPLYHVPNRSGTVILLSATLWRLVNTPIFKKYIKRLGLSAKNLKVLPDLRTNKEDVTITQAVASGLLPITLEQALLAAECGLIPNTDQVLEPWFMLYLKGQVQTLLPRKK